MFIAMDHFSKWAEAKPIRNHTAQNVVFCILFNIISRFGTPQRMLTDQGAEFESALFKELYQLLSLTNIRKTSHKHSMNVILERFRSTLKSLIAKVVHVNQMDWCELLPAVMSAYQATPHEMTGYSPIK
jgi:hypothetical protein